MKLYGDIKKLSGYDLEPVDLIVGGSPCQNLSVAGNRKGLEGSESGLFLEMIRIIREMREKTNGLYPRFALWENVPGAFSTNDGRDFSAVLGEFARLIEPNAPDVPVPKTGWSNSGILLVSGGGQIAYRTHDAQFWGKTIRDSRTGDVLTMGTPQRRRRIALIADFRGESAAEILFERKRLSGNTEQGGEKGQSFAGASANSIGETSNDNSLIVLNDQGGAQMDVSGSTAMTLRHQAHGHEPIILSFQERSGKPGGEKGILIQEDHVGALSTLNNQMVFDSQVHHGCKEFADGICQTINQEYGTGGNNQPLVVSTRSADTLAVSVGNGQLNQISMSDKANALDTMHDQQAVMQFQAFGVDSESLIGSSLKARNDGSSNCDVVVSAKCADDYKGPNRQYVDGGKCQITNNIVRRLTPLECERLQGFPDGWTDVPGASDAKRYKSLGNSICLPMWEWLSHRFVEMGGVKTIGSLFDGIGGFPLVFKRAGAETLWTSEIEPFCQKVTEYHLAKGDL